MTSTVVALGALAKTIAGHLAMMAVQGSVLALVAFFALVVVRAGKLRPAWQAGIWLVVLAKFALPWAPALPWSLADVIAALRGGGGGPVAVPLSTDVVVAHGLALGPAVGWIALVVAWLAGTIIFATRALVAGRAATRDARRGEPAPPEAAATLALLAAQARLRVPQLAVGSRAVGPHVVGLVRTIIVVPPALVESTATHLLRAALLHELAHVRRRDAIGRALQLAATSLFWFWPIVRIAGRRLDHAREAACDAWAIEAGSLSRPTYARLLVSMAHLRTAAASALAAHALDARVAAVLAGSTRGRIGPIHALGLVAWIVLALGGARTAAARGEPICKYTHELASALMASHPEADLDGDGELSRTEACELQAELRKRAESAPTGEVSVPEAILDEPLCCNCDSNQGARSLPVGVQTGPWSDPNPTRPDQTCQEGITP